jgi:energy-coupling factor transport system ATP-binding protein
MGVTRIAHLEGRSPWSLSGGQKQRVAIASIMAMRPPILVLDEPTSQLDPIGTQEVFSVVKELNQKYNTTVIMAEHKTELVAEYADRVVLMNNGEIMADGPVNKILTDNDALDKISVKACEVSSLGCRLNSLGLTETIPITLNDMTHLMLDLIERKKVKPKPTTKINRPSMKREGETPLLELRNLTHVYPGNITALKNINLSIYKGDFIGLIGQNGAGKTTLIKHFIGLLKPTEGQFLLDGQDTTDMSVPQLAKRIGVVLQNPDHQIFSQSVREEVAFAPTIAALDEEEIEKRTNRAIAAMGLKNYEEEYPFSLSMGVRRKISVASMLSMEPETLIFDEPTTGQDYAGRYEIGEIAKTLNEKEGRTVIMITHDMDLIAKYAKRVVVFGQAQILLDGLTKDVFSEVDTLAKTYLHPPQMTMLAHNLAQHGFRTDVLSVEDFVNSIEFVR